MFFPHFSVVGETIIEEAHKKQNPFVIKCVLFNSRKVEQRSTLVRSEAFSLLIRLDAAKFVWLSLCV